MSLSFQVLAQIADAEMLWSARVIALSCSSKDYPLHSTL